MTTEYKQSSGSKGVPAGKGNYSVANGKEVTEKIAVGNKVWRQNFSIFLYSLGSSTEWSVARTNSSSLQLSTNIVHIAVCLLFTLTIILLANLWIIFRLHASVKDKDSIKLESALIENSRDPWWKRGRHALPSPSPISWW